MPAIPGMEEYDSNKKTETPAKVEDSGWTPVECRHAHSQSSLKNKRPLISEQTQIMKMASKCMDYRTNRIFSVVKRKSALEGVVSQ